jgi:hypothetical protein
MFPQLCNPQLSPRWRFRVVALNLTTLDVDMTVDDDIGTGTDVQAYVQSAVHLGEGWVLAKRIAGFGGINFDVDFMLSDDGGATWAMFEPTGFTADLKNQYFGNFIVQQARADGQPGIVLIPAWDSVTSSTYVWASADDGLTWAKRGLVSKPTGFFRIDTMLAGDNGGNFGSLVPGPSLVRPADVTLPDRYNP